MSALKKTPPVIAPKPQKQIWKKIDHPAFYANIMQVGLSPFDVSIAFGKVAEANAEEITCIPQATVTLSPEQAANLMTMLAASLQGYVGQFGNLRAAVVGKPGVIGPTGAIGPMGNNEAKTGAPKTGKIIPPKHA
jgi:hypothetical protein